MKNKVFIAMLLVCALASVAVYGAWAQAESLLGVKAGDNFTYSFEVFWSSTDPSKVVSQVFSNLNQTLSIHLNVTSVGGTTAFLDITRVMRDGTHTSTPGYIGVSSGLGVGALLFIIGANLTAGDKAYIQSDPAAVSAGAAAESFTITETVTLTYLGTSREVNHYYNSTTDADGTVIRDAYYDKATGILLEMTLSHSLAVNVDEADSEHWKITQFNSAETTPPNGGGTGGTNSFDWSSLLVPAVIVVVFVVVVVAALLVMRRRRKPQMQAPTTSPVETPPQ